MRSEQEIRKELKKVCKKQGDASWNNKTNVWTDMEVKRYVLLWVINDSNVCEAEKNPSERITPIMGDAGDIGKVLKESDLRERDLLEKKLPEKQNE